MTSDMNKVYLEGVLATVPELRRPPKTNVKRLSGLTVFTLAVKQEWKGEWRSRIYTKTHHFKIVVWGEKW